MKGPWKTRRARDAARADILELADLRAHGLTANERDALQLRHGHEGWTFEEIAEALGVTKEGARHLVASAKDKLLWSLLEEKR